jgi:hypothetical protein
MPFFLTIESVYVTIVELTLVLQLIQGNTKCSIQLKFVK